MSIKRSRATRKRSKSYLSPSQKKTRNISVITFISAGVVALAAVAMVIFFSHDWSVIREQQREAQASEIKEETGVPETTSDEEAEKARKEEERKAFEAHVLSIEPDFEFAHFRGEPTLTPTGDDLLDRAYRLAAGYDYDAAVLLLKTVTGYGNIPEYRNALQYFYECKASLRKWEINNNITHIFFHSLIVNPGITFDPKESGYKLNDYNEAMTTVNEFVAIMESMYEKGFVLVDIYDVARIEIQADGSEKMTYQSIMLPEDKIPFILSIDDTNYYEYMTGDGFANHLVVTEDGRVQNDYTLKNGETITGSFDVIPILEDFIEMHPDFSYKGGRGMLGVTGYNGVLGYRTSNYWYDPNCPYFEDNEVNRKYFREEIYSGYNENIEEDKVTATMVADAIKAMNWHFASHTWGHKRLGEVGMPTIVWDSDMWEREIMPIVGKTDLLIFPYGNDIGMGVSWRTYTFYGYNERYETLKHKYGFNYFFNVDSSVYFMQRTDEYFRQGRRNLDGDRLWEAVYADEGYEGWKNRTEDLFDDPRTVIDELRPELQKFKGKDVPD
jgi:hypothetical protein